MARALGISKTWLSLIINGKKNPSAYLSKEIEKYTNGEVKREELRPDLFGHIK